MFRNIARLGAVALSTARDTSIRATGTTTSIRTTGITSTTTIKHSISTPASWTQTRAFSNVPSNALTAFRQQHRSTQPSAGTLMEPSTSSIASPFGGPNTQQCRWKSLGSFYRPSTVRRKRKLGFLVRQRSRTGRKIVQRRRLKGRWYLTH